MAGSDSTPSWYHASAADWIGLGAAVMAAIITKGASLGETAALSQDAKAAENAGNYFFGIVGSVPGVVESTATATSKDSKVSPGQAFTREVFAGWAGYIATGATDVLVTGLLSAAGLTFGAPVIVGATAIAAGYAVTKYLSSEIEKSDAIANAAEKAAAAAASSTADSDPISNRQYALDDGSLVTVQTDGTLNIQTALGTYQYDAGGNPFSYTDTAGVSLNYDSVTGQITGVNTTNPLEGLLTIGPDGIQITDQSTGVDVGTLSVDSSGSFQLSQTGVGTLTVPNTQSNQDISFAKDNGDGTTTTTTLAADGNSVATTEVDANGNVLLTSLTDISNGTNQSTTSFMDADGNFLGSLQTTSTVGTDSTTTVSSQLDASGLLIGTTSTITSNDGSSEVNSKDSQGNTLSEQIIASDGSAVVTTFNSLTDPNLNSTVSKDSNGDIFETSTTVAGDTPGSYVSTTLDANGALIEKENRTTDDSGTTDSQAYYEGGRLSSTSDIAADGSRTDTQYEDSSDPKITQSSHFDDNGDLVSQSSTQKNESDGSYLTTSTNPSGQTLSTLVEQADGSMTQTIFNNPNDANLKTVIENDAQGDLVGVSTTTAGTDSDYLTVRQNGDGETTGTDKTNITYDDQGQKSEQIQSYDANGVPTGSNDEVTSPDGHVSATIDGNGVSENLNNATVNIDAESSATIGGSDDTIAAGANSSVALAAGSDNDALTLTAAGAVAVADGDFGEVINSSSNALSFGQDVGASIVGGGNSLTGTNDALTLSGSGDSITGSGDTIAASNDSLMIWGRLGSAADTVTGDGNTITANSSVLTLDGSGDIVSGGSNTLTLIGSGEAVSGNFDTITLDADSSATLNNYDSSITLGAGVSLTSNGDGYNTINASADDTLVIGNDSYYSDTLNVSDDQNITLDGGVYINVAGSGNAITAEGGDTLTGNNDAITLLGSGDSITGSGDAIAASNDSLMIWGSVGGTADTVTGDGNTIMAYNSVLTLDGSGESVSGGSNTLTLMGSGESVSGNFDAITLDADSSATLNNYDSSITLGAGVSLTSNGDGYNTINASADDTLVIGNDSYYPDTLNVSDDQNITLDGGVYINVVGSGNAIAAEGGDTLTGNNDAITLLGSGDSITGSGDAIAASNDSLTIWGSVGGTADTVTGDGNTITAYNSVLTLEGEGEVISASSSSINVGSDGSATLNSYGDTITLGFSASLTSEGVGANTINANDSDTLIIDASYYSDTLNVADNQGITLNSGAFVSVVGDGNDISLEGGDSLSASNSSITIQGAGDSITGAGDAISASGDSLSISNRSGGANDVVTGDNNTIAADLYSAITLDGAGEVVSGAFDSFTLTGSGDNVSGNYDTVYLGADDSISLNSYDDSIVLGAGSSVTSIGDGFNTIYATSDDVLTIGGTVNSGYYFTDTLNVTGDQNITLNSGASVSVVGSANTIAVEGGDTLVVSNNTINVLGGGDAITGFGDSIIASNESLSISNQFSNGVSDVVTGDNNTVTANFYSTITLDGSNETLSGSDSSFSLTGSSEVLTGDYDSLYFGDGSSANLNGYGHSINLGAGVNLTSEGWGANTISTGANDTINIGATGGNEFSTDTVNSSGSHVYLDFGAAVNVVGGGNDITSNGGDSISASNDTINILGSGSAIAGGGDTISANNQSLSITNRYSNASDVIVGNNNTVSAGNSTITLEGSGETLSGSNNTISVTAGNSLTVSGNGNVLSGSSDQITLSGDGSSLVVQGNKDNFAVTGTNDRIIDDRTDGTSVLYNWNNSGFETETVYSGSDDSGDIIGGYGYSGTGSGVDVPGGYGGGDGGGYGFAGSPSVVSSALSRDIGSIAQYDLTHGNLSAADAAQSALHQAVDTANSTPTVSAGSSVLESAKWDQQVITWSLADTQGAQVAPFSGFMGSEDESVVQAAFNAWGAADPGLVFKEVSDSAQSDIRVGFGDFNTATTGVVGYTSFQTDDGQMESGVVVRVEDPAQDALTTGPDGQQTYAGTDATLSQVLQHEIGHALGLGDNADQNSVMNYQLTASNRTLDRTDLAGIGSLYGSGPSTASVGSSGVSQLIQAMSTFNADAGVADTTLLPPASLNNNVILSASAHAA